MPPFVQNVTDDPHECPPLGISRVKPGDVVEVDELAARALEDHPIFEPHAGPAFTTPDPEPDEDEDELDDAGEPAGDPPAAVPQANTPPPAAAPTAAQPPAATEQKEVK